MGDWFMNLSVPEYIYFFLGIISTVFLIIQIIMLCFSSFGGDADMDADADIDGDFEPDSGVSIFTVKSLTAFFAVGSWSGLLTCALAADNLWWLSIIVAVIAGGIAMALVVVALNFLHKMQCNGAVRHEMLVGQRATVYVSIPPSRSGKGKITLTAQGRFMEMDAVTDDTEKLFVNEAVEIVSTDDECTVVKKIPLPEAEDLKTDCSAEENAEEKTDEN